MTDGEMNWLRRPEIDRIRLLSQWIEDIERGATSWKVAPEWAKRERRIAAELRAELRTLNVRA